MLPAAVRLRTAADHRLVGRRGRRARRGSVVVSLLTPGVSPSTAARPSPEGRGPATPSPTRAGVVVGKAVGGAVVRTRVKRRLREVLRSRLVEVPGGSLLVVRALPGADVGSRQLDEWVGSALLALSAASRSGRPQQPGAGAR